MPIGIESLEGRCVPAAVTTLLIENNRAFDRVAEPVTSGVPIPRSLNLTSPGQLRILDTSGRDVPAQFRVLGRWGGGVTDVSRPIRWLEVHFAADVPANAIATYTLDDAGSGSAAGRLTAVQSGDRITVDTGPARFEIDRNRFDLFRTVWLDVNADGTFADDERIVSQTSTAGPFVQRTGMEFLGSGAASRSVVLEEAGPLRAVIRAEGFHAADGRHLLRFVTRMTFHAGQSYVEVHHTIIEGRQGGSGNESIENQVATNIDRAGLRLHINLNGPITASLRGNEPAVHSGALAAGRTAWIAQDRLSDWSGPMSYRGAIGGITVETGQRAARAWIGLGDGRWGVAVGTRDFYQKNPQRLAVAADGAVVVEFPSEPFVIRQAMGLGESAVIWFHSANASAAVIERVMEGIGKDRLLAVTPGAWARDSGAFGDVPGPMPSRWAGIDDFLRGSIALSLEHASSGASFGLMHYLDMPIDRFGRASHPDDTAWGNSYWDPAATLAAQFARTGDGRLLEDLLFPMARHFYTTDMYDPDDAGSFTSGIGGARGIAHRGAWTGEYHYLESLWDYYALTGDPRALERGVAAARTYAFHPQWSVTADQGGFETTTRSLSQKFNTMMEAWLATGDAALKTALDAQVREYLARRFTPEGFATAGPASGSSYRAEQAFMVLLGMHDTIFKYFQLTGDPIARAFVVTVPDRISQYHRVGRQPGAADFMRFHTNVRVDRTAGGGFTVSRTTPNGNSDDFFYVESHVGLATALARAWQVSGDPIHRLRAEELLDDVVPRLTPGILDKAGAMTGRRLLAGVALLTRDLPPAAPAPATPPPSSGPADHQSVRVLDARSDAFVDGRFGAATASRHGTETSLTVYREGWSDGRIRSLLRFDLAAIPARRTLSRAVLRLTQIGGEGPAVPLAATIRPVSRAWTEDEVNWRFAHTDAAWANDGGDVLPSGIPTTLPVFALGRIVEVDISPLVRDWLAGVLPNHGLLIDTETSDVSQSYASRESPRVTDRPALVLEFEPETPSAAPTSISLSAGRIAENAGAGSLVGIITALDPDAGDRIALTLPVGRGDNASFVLEADRLHAARPFDFETRSRYEVVVRATDRSGLWIERTFVVEVADVDEPPVLDAAPPRVKATRNGMPIVLAPAATVVDPDTRGFTGGTLTVRVASGGTTRDRLRLLGDGNGTGQVSVQGSTIRYGGIPIGTIAGGVGASRLVITFNRRAGGAAVQAVLRRVAFQTTASPATSPRRAIRFTLNVAATLTSPPLDVAVDVG